MKHHPIHNTNKIFKLNSAGSAAIGPLLMFVSAFIFAILDVLIKILGPSFRVWDIAFYRFGFGLVILTVIFGRRENPFTGNNRKLLILRGISGSIAFVSLVTAIRLIPVSTALVFFYSFPAFAAFFSSLVFKEKITAAEVFCIIVAFIGVTVLFDFSLQGSLLGQIMALIGGAAAGITICMIKKLRETNGPVIIYLYFCLIGTALTLPSFIASPQIPTTKVELLIVAGIVFTSISAQLLMNQGFKYCKSWEGGLFLTSELIFISIFGIFLLGELVNWHFWSGGILIFGSVVVLNYLNAQRVPAFSNPKKGA